VEVTAAGDIFMGKEPPLWQGSLPGINSLYVHVGAERAIFHFFEGVDRAVSYCHGARKSVG
jgi:hypothetical protein